MNTGPSDLTFRHVARINAQRCDRWHDGFPETDAAGWTGADWSNAMQGEAGEVGNVVKKLRRIETGLRGNRDHESYNALLDKLGTEIADTFIYLDLLATFYDIDIPREIIAKFNAVSDREDFPERLP